MEPYSACSWSSWSSWAVWAYLLNETGGIEIGGIGNATEYKIEIWWLGNKVNETIICTALEKEPGSAGNFGTDGMLPPYDNYTQLHSNVGYKYYIDRVGNVHGPVKVNVTYVDFTFKDAAGNDLYKLPEKVIAIAPNQTLLTLTTYSGVRSQNGIWKVSHIIWNSNNIVPAPTPETYVKRVPTETTFPWTIACKVYSLTINLKDFFWSLFEGNVDVTPPNATTKTYTITGGTLTWLQVQNGTDIPWKFANVFRRYWIVNATPPDLTVDKNTVYDIRCNRLATNIGGSGYDLFVVTEPAKLLSAKWDPVAKVLTYGVDYVPGGFSYEEIYSKEPGTIYVDGKKIRGSYTLDELKASTKSTWYFDPTPYRLYIKVLHSSPTTIDVDYKPDPFEFSALQASLAAFICLTAYLGPLLVAIAVTSLLLARRRH